MGNGNFNEFLTETIALANDLVCEGHIDRRAKKVLLKAVKEEVGHEPIRVRTFFDVVVSGFNRYDAMRFINRIAYVEDSLYEMANN